MVVLTDCGVTVLTTVVVWLHPSGASQGFDTDDGSSWYDINNNFMFMADGEFGIASVGFHQR